MIFANWFTYNIIFGRYDSYRTAFEKDKVELELIREEISSNKANEEINYNELIEREEQKCEYKYLDKYRCDGKSIERKRQNFDCSTDWVYGWRCSYDCEDGECIYESIQYEEEPELEEKEESNICDCSSNIYNCDNFLTHSEAQVCFEYCGGISNDIHWLDGDDDGVACEALP